MGGCGCAAQSREAFFMGFQSGAAGSEGAGVSGCGRWGEGGPV